MNPPETRPSLLLRLRDTEDREAWTEFSGIYRPVILRLAQIKGLQTADAEDLAQQVLLSVAHAIEGWEPDSQRAKFRTWLRRITENAILNALTRGLPDRASGDEEMRLFLQQSEKPNSADSELLQTEFRREVFQQAARRIRSEFSDETWESFWLTAIDGLDVSAAADRLGRTKGSIYASRSRVMKRLRQEVERCCYDEA